MMRALLQRLQEPEVTGCAVDGADRIDAHRTVLRRKAIIREVFEEFHEVFRDLDARLFDKAGEGLVVELGAGVFPVRETTPGVIATDIVPAPHLDRTLDAEAMDLSDGSVRAFYLQNVFHHFPHPSRFFDELSRTLAVGGGAILIEPNDGPLAAWLYPRLFATEGFDKQAPSWEADVAGPMSGANQALSHLVFDRDLEEFERRHPDLEVVHRDVLRNWVRYLASGGLNFRSLVPELAVPLLRGVEWLLAPLRRKLGLHRVVVVRRRGPGAAG
jgi:SAM-dependent methyltransferase